MPRMDLSLRSGRPRASRKRPLQTWRRIDSSPNAINDRLGTDLLQDIKPCPQYVRVRVAPRSRLPWSRARSGTQKFPKTSPTHANVTNPRAPARLSPPRNPIQIDKRFG